MGTVRTTFVIDEQGTITNIIQKVKSAEHHLQILGIKPVKTFKE
jgi:thioredoxin-dependent peroxiredoxin